MRDSLARFEFAPAGRGDRDVIAERLAIVERDLRDRPAIIRDGLVVGDEMDQRDVVEMVRLVIGRVANHPVDPIGGAFVVADADRAEPHAVALVDLGLVDAVRRGQHPVRRDQRPAAAVREIPFVTLVEFVIGPAGEVGKNLCLPRRAIGKRVMARLRLDQGIVAEPVLGRLRG